LIILSSFVLRHSSFSQEVCVSVPTPEAPQRLTFIQWLIVLVACIGFAFDSYELLMMPLIARPGLAELLGVDPTTPEGAQQVAAWFGYISWASALSGGIFGLLGGYLTDLFGRRRVLVWSILIYAFSALAAGWSTSKEMLLILRCTTFIGVCVEFVAAIAWLAELFPHPKQRERILGWTQAFSSVGGIMVTGAYFLANRYAAQLPAIAEGNNAWRYTLISGVIPALPLILIRPFLPESPEWQKKRALGTLRRPSLRELFDPVHRRTALVTAAMVACSYGTAYGAIQLSPQMVPGLVPELSQPISGLQKERASLPADSPRSKELRGKIAGLQRELGETISNVQFYQETGGLTGRIALAILAVWIISRRKLIRVFLVPGLILIPLVFCYPAAGNLTDNNLDGLKRGIFLTGFLTVAQFSFWGNYLPRVYPVHLRGTGESFAANVGGRMVGTSAALAATQMAPYMPGTGGPRHLAYAAAIVAFSVYALGLLLSFALPEPSAEMTKDE
jgi:MFS family permease